MNIHLCLSVCFKCMVRCQLKWKSFPGIWILPGQWLCAYISCYSATQPNNILTNQKWNVYYLIFLQLPSHLKVVTHILLTFISMSYDPPLSFSKIPHGCLSRWLLGLTWSTVPFHPQVPQVIPSLLALQPQRWRCIVR